MASYPSRNVSIEWSGHMSGVRNAFSKDLHTIQNIAPCSFELCNLQCQKDTFFLLHSFFAKISVCSLRVLDINEMNSDVLSMFL